MTEILVPSTEFKQEFIQGGIKAAATAHHIKTRDLPYVPLDSIVVVKNLNVRIEDEEYQAHVNEIAESIMENGFYAHKPLSGYVGKEGENPVVYCTGGFTRLRAAKIARDRGAPIEALPMIFKPSGTSMADLTLALDVDNIGSPLRPYERAIVIKRLVDFGWDEPTIARKMRLSEQYVKDLLYLMSLPNGLRMIVVKGIGSAHHVIQLARKVGPTEALRAFESSASGTSENPETPTTAPVSPAVTAAVTAKNTRVIPKKTLFSAIDFCLLLPSGGLTWLKKWRDGDEETIAELDAWKPPRKQRSDKQEKTPSARGKGRPKGSKKTTPTTTAGDDDPL